MTDYILSDETRAKLKKISTASIATALFKRGLRNQFIQGVVPVSPKAETMVGQAFTLRYIPAREDRNPITVFRNPEHPQRVAIETWSSSRRWPLTTSSRRGSLTRWSHARVLPSRLCARTVSVRGSPPVRSTGTGTIASRCRATSSASIQFGTMM